MDGLLVNELLENLYELLYSNTKFNNFSRNKIVNVKASTSLKDDESRYVTLTDSILCRHLTTLEEFMNVANKHLYIHHSGGYSTDGIYRDLEVTVWKQKINANKKILNTQLINDSLFLTSLI